MTARKKNRGAEYLRRREANMALKLENEKRSEQRIECQYCEIATRHVVTRLESYQERAYRSMPNGFTGGGK